jgi:small conductance mechanosensitive channel
LRCANDFMGTVLDIDLRATVIRTCEGQLVTIPNSEVLQKPIVNFTASGQRRVDIPVGVSYGDDLAKAKRVAIEAVGSIDYRDRSGPVDLYYEGFGDSSINFTIRFWIDFKTQPDFLRARSDAVMRIESAFEANDITIPFPIRRLELPNGAGIGNRESGIEHTG